MRAVFAADVGGTNARFAIVNLDGTRPRIVLREEAATRSTANFYKAVDAFLQKAEERGYRATTGGFSVAGPPSEKHGRRRIVMNNAHLTLAETDLERKTRLTHARVLNDFEAIAYALDTLPSKKVKVLRKGRPVPGAARAIIGPGTGLGHAILIPLAHGWKPMLSEAHHSDMALHGKDEYALGAFTNHEERRAVESPVWHEDLLSGRGLERLYRYIRLTRFKENALLPRKLDAAAISESRRRNPCSKAALDKFAELLARRCRNFALDTSARGGVYLCGGVVQKNPSLFGKPFLDEFSKHRHPQWQALLQRIPVSLVLDDDAGLLGAATVAR